jgi:hypothetical protein
LVAGVLASREHATLRRDDGVLWATRVLGGFIVPFLLAAFALYLVPSRTGWFAWDIKPTMTTMLLGAGYAAGAYFFTRVVFADRWHEIHLGFLPITAFMLFMAIATAQNLDRFDHGRVAFWVWTVLYVLTPILVPMTWLRNRRTDPRTLRKGDVAIPNSVRSALVVAGAAMSVVAVVLLVSPSTMVDVWPWTGRP